MRFPLLFLALLLGCADPSISADPTPAQPTDALFLVVLGIGQDGGVPQAGNTADAGWTDPAKRRHVVSLAVVDPVTRQRWLFDATPDLPEQLYHLDQIAPTDAPKPGLNGVFLTHAHIGHYTGLMYFGHEVMGAQQVPVHAMPRMADFLRTNGPWSQLVRYGNIDLRTLQADSAIVINDRLRVTPLLVPHRQEFSEVVGFRIEGPTASALFIPDIDSWEDWDAEGTRIEDEIAKVDVAYLDATFYANGEIPGRDMSGFPHPFITHSMERFADLPASEKAKVRFIHLNHTNPALWEGTEARRTIAENGFRVAVEGEWVEL
ncbi:MAG: MBL fold metallo-hydrolase [Bacteroidota bacterium]